MIEALAYYLKIDLRMTLRTVKTNMVPFRTTVKRAFHKGMIRQDLFFDYVPERIMPKRPWLTNDEITRLTNMPHGILRGIYLSFRPSQALHQGKRI
jgi:hypothetical protein